MRAPRWEERRPFPAAEESRLAQAMGVSRLLARLLLARGLADAADASDFLHPRLAALADPLETGHVEEAVGRLTFALRRRETVVLYGDYDVDGVTSLALLHRFLKAEGLDTVCFLPTRDAEGYGLSEEALERLFARHSPTLLIALDCGTTSCAEAAILRARGVDLIIVDHHEPKPARPACTALINPKLHGGNADLCTAGLVFKLCHGFQKITGSRMFNLRESLDLVALGTLCDLAPLRGENRILARRGIEQLPHSRWPGLRALMSLADVKAPVEAADVGFRLGPRLNAAGRLDTAETALHLLLTDDEDTGRRLARQLDQRNRERQALETHVLELAMAQAGEIFDPRTHRSLVVGGSGWHHGVLGIVASRLARHFHRPAIVVGFDEGGQGRGSGRAIDGLCLVEALRECAPLLEKFGGHRMAAGLSVNWPAFPEFRAAFERAVAARLAEEHLTPTITLDAHVEPGDLSYGHLDELALLEPCGPANPSPLFWARAVAPLREPEILKGKHVRFSLRGGRQSLAAIFFNGVGHGGLPKPPWDVAFRIRRNEFRQRVTLQLEVRHLRASVT